jgi:hypothetical protein
MMIDCACAAGVASEPAAINRDDISKSRFGADANIFSKALSPRVTGAHAVVVVLAVRAAIDVQGFAITRIKCRQLDLSQNTDAFASGYFARGIGWE